MSELLRLVVGTFTGLLHMRLPALVIGFTLFAASQASAYDYPYCAQGRGVGIPGDCSYQTYEQCQASASGRALFCNVNPRAAFNRQGGERSRERRYREGAR